MKKKIALLLTMLMVLSMIAVGCSNEKDQNENQNNDQNTTEQTSNNQNSDEENNSTSEDQNENEEDNTTDEKDSPLPEKITDEPITLKVVRLSFADIRPPCDEVWMWQRYEELTGIRIDWEEVPRGGFQERKNIIMATNELPDAFYNMPFTSDEIVSYGTQGMFITLNELIDEHAYSLKELIESESAINAAVTMPDGNIYSLPMVRPNPLSNSLRYYINDKWLQELNLEVPDTIDELTDILDKFKKEDANGNGDKNDEYPIYFSADFIPSFEYQIVGSYGLGNRGQNAMTEFIDMGDDGKVRFYPATENYREVWQLFNKWWENEYFHPETFSGTEYTKWVADASKDVVGFFSWVQPNYIGSEVDQNYVGFATLEGPHGDRIFSWMCPKVRSNSAFMITNKNEYPVESIKWIDYFYSPEGTEFGTFGEEGVTFTRTEDGGYKLIDEIINYESGPQVGAFQWTELNYGGVKPAVMVDEPIRLEAWGIDVQDRFRFAREGDIEERYMSDEYWPILNPTLEESSTTKALLTDIGQFISEMRVKFVTGELDIYDDNEWDNYLDTLNKMGLEEYIEIKQAQYERIK